MASVNLIEESSCCMVSIQNNLLQWSEKERMIMFVRGLNFVNFVKKVKNKMPLVDGKEVPERDVGPVLDFLRMKQKTPAMPASRIVEVTATKFLCPYHAIKTVIEMKESSQRDKRLKMNQFECSCGITYVKKGGD